MEHLLALGSLAGWAGWCWVKGLFASAMVGGGTLGPGEVPPCFCSDQGPHISLYLHEEDRGSGRESETQVNKCGLPS